MKYYHTLLLRVISIIPSKTRCEQCLSTNEFKFRGSYSICRVDEVVEENKSTFAVIYAKFLEDLQKNDDLQKKQTIMKICGAIAEVNQLDSPLVGSIETM